MHKFGDQARDTVTGFTGTITARCEYLGDATQYRVEAVNKTTGEPINHWVAESRLSSIPTTDAEAE